MFKLLKQRAAIADMHFMLQKEVVDRMAAAPGGKDYGRLTVMLAAYAEVDSLFDVAPTAPFNRRPGYGRPLCGYERPRSPGSRLASDSVTADAGDRRLLAATQDFEKRLEDAY